MILSYDGNTTYFSDRELADRSNGAIVLDPRFESHLRTLRHMYGKAMVLNSVCRTPAHNKAIGGHPRSLHLTANPIHPTEGCMAMDVNTVRMTATAIKNLTSLAWELGWSLGFSSGFVHMDRRIDIGLKQIRWNY